MAKNAGESGFPCLTPDPGFTCTVRTTPLPTPNTKDEVSMDSMSEIMGRGGAQVLEECDEIIVVYRIKSLREVDGYEDAILHRFPRRSSVPYVFEYVPPFHESLLLWGGCIQE